MVPGFHLDIDAIEAAIVERVARDEPVEPIAVVFLLRRYAAGGTDAVRDALGLALSRWLADLSRTATVVERSTLLTLLVETAAFSDDDRVAGAIESLIGSLAPAWSDRRDIESAASAIDACLRAADLDAGRAVAATAVDALEALIHRAYEPGIGVVRREAATPHRADQVRTASALLTAYALSARLPYAMLAEELIHIAVMPVGDRDATADGDAFTVDCEAARVLGRLAVLHEDEDYRTRAVVAPGADYRAAAHRMLAPYASEVRARGTAAAIYALALVELESPNSYAN